MTDRPDSEDRALQEVLGAFGVAETEPGEDPGPPPGTEDPGTADDTRSDETLRRLYLETMSLLAYDAEPVEPRPQVKDRLMAALGSPARAGEEGAGSGAEPPGRSSAVVPFEERVEERAGGRDDRRAPAKAGGVSWASFAAAVIALLALGLAGVLWVELDRSREALARLEQEQQELTARLEMGEILARDVGRFEDLVRVVSTPGVEICPLRPVGESPLAPGAFAVLYIPPGSRSLYLVASDLEPADRGLYKVWFNTPGGAMPAGVIEVGEGALGERTTLRIPPDLMDAGSMLSVTVTLEQSPDVDAPTGPTVLYGDEKMQVL